MLNSIKSFILTIKNYDKKFDYLWFILIPILSINYLITGNLYSVGYDISLNIDKALPLISIFIIPYIFWYLYIPIGLLPCLFHSRTKYMKAFLTMFSGMIICYIIYIIFPTQYTRPLIEDTGVLDKLILAIYSNDRPFNCFPSIHVLITYIIMRFTSIKKSKLFFFYVQITGILIILSTLFIKQHFILDILGSIILAEILIPLVNLIKVTTLEKILAFPYKIINYKKNKITVEESSNSENI